MLARFVLPASVRQPENLSSPDGTLLDPAMRNNELLHVKAEGQLFAMRHFSGFADARRLPGGRAKLLPTPGCAPRSPRRRPDRLPG